jgi:CheY-like chemotaxis protein
VSIVIQHRRAVIPVQQPFHSIAVEHSRERGRFPASPHERIVKTDRKILVVEDDDLIRDLVVDWLAEAGYRVLRASGSVADSNERPSLIVADLSTRKQDGCALVKVLRSMHPAVPILLISGWFRAGLHGWCEAARELGVGGVLSIPFSREELLSAVGEALGIGAADRSVS